MFPIGWRTAIVDATRATVKDGIEGAILWDSNGFKFDYSLLCGLLSNQIMI